MKSQQEAAFKMPVYNLCRICLTEDTNTEAMQPLFDEENARCAEIVQRIEECGGIVLKPHEEFPKMICLQCLDSLNVSVKFRSMCQASEHALLDAIVKSELKIEPQDGMASLANKDQESRTNSNDIFFDLRSDFIEAHEVDLVELTGGKKEEEDELILLDEEGFDEDEDDAEYMESSACDSDYDFQDFKRSPKKHSKSGSKTQPRRKAGKRGRPRLNECVKDESILKSVKPGRGRKKLKEEPASNICEVCGNIYSKRSLLNMHMRRHLAEKPFECEICGKTFACPSEISRHIRVHTGEKPYVCRFCGRTFADRSTNIKHERIHTNERPFTCQTCGKSFTYSNVLKNHMLTHTGEKPFPCVPCKKTFSRKHQLDQHLSTITHQQTVKNLTARVLESCNNDVEIQITDLQQRQLRDVSVI